jgi:hypothetical protein
MTTVPLIALYRELLAEKLISATESKLQQLIAGPRCEPVLAAFLDILDNMDLLDALKAVWTWTRQNFSQKQKVI